MAAVTETASDHATAQSRECGKTQSNQERGPATYVKPAPEDHTLSFPISFSLELSSRVNHPQRHIQIIGNLEEESALCKTSEKWMMNTGPIARVLRV
jgi:hypothetical protein